VKRFMATLLYLGAGTDASPLLNADVMRGVTRVVYVDAVPPWIDGANESRHPTGAGAAEQARCARQVGRWLEAPPRAASSRLRLLAQLRSRCAAGRVADALRLPPGAAHPIDATAWELALPGGVVLTYFMGTLAEDLPRAGGRLAAELARVSVVFLTGYVVGCGAGRLFRWGDMPDATRRTVQRVWEALPALEAVLAEDGMMPYLPPSVAPLLAATVVDDTEPLMRFSAAPRPLTLRRERSLRRHGTPFARERANLLRRLRSLRRQRTPAARERASRTLR
jgi:hypothetical protein